MDSNYKTKIVYTIVDRDNGKSFWVRVGVGFMNQDGSINIKLDAVPTNGTLQIRDYEPSHREDQGFQSSSPTPGVNQRRRYSPVQVNHLNTAPPAGVTLASHPAQSKHLSQVAQIPFSATP